MTPTADGDRPAPRALRSRRVEVVLEAGNLPFVLRTVAGMSALAIGANAIGVVVVTLLIIAVNATATPHQRAVLLAAAAAVIATAFVIGVVWATLVQRRTLGWLLRNQRPDEQDARRAIGTAREVAQISAVLWLLSTLVIGIVAAAVDLGGSSLFGIVGGVFVAGMASSGITYLLVGRVNAPVARLALASVPPENAPIVGIRWRLTLVWMLTTGAPVLGILLILAAPGGRAHVIGASMVVAVITLALGAGATALVARAIGRPLREIVAAQKRVGDGDLEVEMPLDDAGEIGLLQHGFNDMVAGLRERDRVTDLFGRHVGPAVAQEALRRGVTLSGELRECTALFVDITGSTRLTRETDPQEFVAMLNRFFEVVVAAVEENGGLLNKFEGDAALCVFGTPVDLPDRATPALRAARRIRDRVTAMGEVQIGVGVAAGPVVAGQIGASSRLEFTVIGDAVNLAARLTDLAKRRPGHLLASGAVVEQADAGERRWWQADGEEVLRGTDVPTALWRA